jgi:competence protein ComEA
MKTFATFWLGRRVLLAPLLLLLSAAAFALPEGKININEADAEEIAEALDGVGLRRAEAIVEYRNEFGRFESIEELVAVSGIGERILDSNKDRIVLAE